MEAVDGGALGGSLILGSWTAMRHVLGTQGLMGIVGIVDWLHFRCRQPGLCILLSSRWHRLVAPWTGGARSYQPRECRYRSDFDPDARSDALACFDGPPAVFLDI